VCLLLDEHNTQVYYTTLQGGLLVAKEKQTVEKEEKNKQYPVSMRQLLEAGVHFGHQTRRWDPRMDKFIYTSRNDIHVIDLQQTVELIKDAYNYVKDVVSKKGTILFVGTKKQAQDAVESEAIRCKMPYVNQRWLGGTLTNNVTISNSVKQLKQYQDDQEQGVFNQLSKKEASRKTKKLARLEHYLGGIKDMRYLPKVIFVVDTKKEELAIHEAKKLGIKVIGLVDTNGDPTNLDFPIPGNDDAIRAVKLICSVFSEAVIQGAQAGAETEAAEENVQVAKERYEQSTPDNVEQH
jgi:small subunit ribosomal protein S2